VPAAGNAIRYERVAMFYHREPETRVKFVRLETENGKILSLTGKLKNTFFVTSIFRPSFVTIRRLLGDAVQ
jgi:hypothetical protein